LLIWDGRVSSGFGTISLLNTKIMMKKKRERTVRKGGKRRRKKRRSRKLNTLNDLLD